MVFANNKDDEFIITCGCADGLHWKAAAWDDIGEDYYLTEKAERKVGADDSN